MRQILILQSEYYQEDPKDKEDHQTDIPLPYLITREGCVIAYEYYYYCFLFVTHKRSLAVFC